MTLFAVLLAGGLVVASVSLHYEALRLLAIMLRSERRWYSNRLRASLLVLGCMVAHAIEVILFGLGFQLLEWLNHGNGLQGRTLDRFDCNYYSIVVYTSIGFGDVVPVTSAMRFVTAVEGLTGAILIAWTASFMFFHMRRFWEIESRSA